MRLIDKVLTSFIGVNLIISSFISMNSTAIYIDNDDSQGYSNSRNGFSTYLTSGDYYRGDARTQSSGGTKQYLWNLDDARKTSSTGFYVSLYAYVNDSAFTDPNAKYYAMASYMSRIGTLNQNTAARGWNYVGRVNMTPLTAVGEKTVTFMAIELDVGSVSGYTTAADGVQIYY